MSSKILNTYLKSILNHKQTITTTIIMTKTKKTTPNITINKVYTRQGDSGETRLIGGQKKSKSNLRIHAYGVVDELNSVVGGCIVSLKKTNTQDPALNKLIEIQFRIQHELFNLGTLLAILPGDIKPGMPDVGNDEIERLELEIDKYNKTLNTLKSFVLPGGSESAVWFHLARTVCRRAERIVVELSNNEELNPNSIAYLNRLSDAFFVWSRWVNMISGYDEKLWQP
jgi:cob(I)alamin adenosyltransferase